MKLMKRGSKKKERLSIESSGGFAVSFPTSFSKLTTPSPTKEKHQQKSLSSSEKKKPFSLSSAAIMGAIGAAASSQFSKSPAKLALFREDEEIEFLKRLQPPPAHRAAPIKTSYLEPPREINIDPNAIPPSPMRDPNMNAPTRKPLSNLLNSPSRYSSNSQENKCHFGDPVGDIGMKTQLCDAQRLVRVILGKSQNDLPLETESILQAIRAFALMKAELEQLRKQQEYKDGDPPAILPLPSPSTCNTSHLLETPQKLPSALSSPGDIHRRAIIEAAKKIASLEQSLGLANAKIQNLETASREKDVLQVKLQEENIQLKEKLKTNNERLSRYRQEATKAMQTKDARGSKFERSIYSLKHDISIVIGSLEGLNSTPADERHARMQEENEVNLQILKKSLASMPPIASTHTSSASELLQKSSKGALCPSGFD